MSDDDDYQRLRVARVIDRAADTLDDPLELEAFERVIAGVLFSGELPDHDKVVVALVLASLLPAEHAPLKSALRRVATGVAHRIADKHAIAAFVHGLDTL